MSVTKKEKEAPPQDTMADLDGMIWTPAPHLSMRALTEPRAG